MALAYRPLSRNKPEPMRHLIALLATASCALPVMAQDCGTPPPTPHQYAYTRDVVANIDVTALRNAGTTCVAIQPHVVRMSDGSGGITQTQLNIGLSFLNAFYYDAGIEFYWKAAPDFANNTDYYTYNTTAGDADTEAGMIALFTTATDAVNVYYANAMTTSSGAICGYAYYPNNSAGSNTIFMVNSCTYGAPNGTFAHEFGHYFNLMHTHEGTENGNADPQAENVPRTGPQANCGTDGDLLCDTQADPRYNSGQFNLATCAYTGAGTDINGVAYSPPVNNVMSYFPDECGGIFTTDQYTRITQGLSTRIAHTAYDLFAPPQSVLAPSSLSLALVGAALQLTWTDNAANDRGYLVERSTTSASTGFRALPFGATAVSGTTYTDATITSSTTYWYRVKASNGDCNTYSNVATFTTGLVYCVPSFASPCDAGTALIVDEFVLTGSGANISNVNSNCSAGGYGNFTGLTCNVTAGTSHAVSVKALSGTGSYFNSYVAAWADWNQDGDFVDAGEQVIASNSVMAPNFSGNIAVPAGAMNGATRLRVRAYDQANPCTITACNQCVFGETEDYTVTVIGGVSANVVLAVKAWLEGPLVTLPAVLMFDSLRTLAGFPLTEPYTVLGFANAAGGGGETTTAGVLAVTGSNAIVDWVRLELRSSSDPSSIVATRHCLIQRDGDVVSAADGTSNVTMNLPSGNYRVAIRHRNHLGCMTSTAIALSGTATTIDFRAAATTTHGTDARKTIGANMALWAGNTYYDSPPPNQVKYTNTDNDRDPILQIIGGVVPTNTMNGYYREDVDMSGVVKYTGTGNDRDPILGNIGGVVPTAVKQEQLP